jgi:alpha-D-ribose 1-methylphosphonate 5-triphosphate synthase subunit PhnH
MPNKTAALTGGFPDAVFDSQSIFKMLMDCMSRPGSRQTVGPDVAPPAPLNIATGAILLTLCDTDTPVWLSAPLAKSVAASWLAFHAGAPATPEKAEARFALIEQGSGLSSLALFSQGTQEYPDRSTTVLLEVGSLDDGRDMVLSGPGIRDSATIKVSGLPETFQRSWAENRAIFPRGVDVILTCGRDFICLPRTARIQMMEE